MMDILAVSVLSFVSLLLVLLLMISYKRTSLSAKNAAVAIPSPRTTLLPSLSLDAISKLPYPPNMLPGARDIVTPHGTMRVYEYGPKDGPKVLLIHGDTTPAPMLGPIAHELVRRGCRVLMFDLWGRGYSDAPLHVRYDSRLYVTQVLYAMASSSIPWIGTGSDGCTIIGYSLGGGIAMSFAAYFPDVVKSLVLLAPGGILRKLPSGYDNFAFRHQTFYTSKYLRTLTGKLLGLDMAASDCAYSVPNQSLSTQTVTTVANSNNRSTVDISAITQWQFDCHQGFLHGFLNNIQHGPIMNQQTDWYKVCQILQSRPSSTHTLSKGIKLQGSHILAIFGQEDTIVVGSQIQQDLVKMLGGDEQLWVAWVSGSHDFPETNLHQVMEHIARFLDLKP